MAHRHTGHIPTGSLTSAGGPARSSTLTPMAQVLVTCGDMEWSRADSFRPQALYTAPHDRVHRLICPHTDHHTRFMCGGPTHPVIHLATPLYIVADLPLDIPAALMKGGIGPEPSLQQGCVH